MDFVARAKALMEKQARTAALVILPLAAAVAAHAGPVLPTGNFSCGAPQAGSCAGSADAQLALAGNGLTGVKFFTSGALLISGPSGSQAQLGMQASGPLNGVFSGTVPLSYDFTLSGGAITTWFLSYGLNQVSGSSNSASVSGSGSGHFTGTTSMNGVNLVSGLTTVEIFLLTVNYTSGSVTVDIPASSIDFNSVAAGVPEPTTGALFGAGIALFGGWRLVRRRKRLALVRDKS